MTSVSDAVVFSRMWLPRPLDAEGVVLFLERLAADPLSPHLVLEVRATTTGIAHLIGVHPPQVPWLHRTLRDLFPGITLTTRPAAVDRPACTAAAEIRFRPDAVALNSSDPVAVTTSILSALSSRLRDGETIALQYLLGPRRHGRHIRTDAADPHQSVWSKASQGIRPLAPHVRGQVEQRLSTHGFLTTIRIGATTESVVTRKQLLAGLSGALGTARSTGVRLTARRLKPVFLDDARTPRRWGQRLSPRELTGLIAWPIGNRELPGVPPIHPRLLMPTVTPSEADRAFGITALPGSELPIGVSARDALMHQVVLGPTGSGKSNILLHQIRADAHAGRAILVIDPKRQLIDDILATCIPEHRIPDVVLLDAADPQAPGLNSLDVGNRNPDVVVDGQLAVFKAIFHDGWGPRTEDIFLSCLLTLARAGTRSSQPHTLLDIPKLLINHAFRQRVLSRMPHDDVLAGFWATYDAMTPGAQSAMIAAPMNKLRRYLLRPAARTILGQAQPAFRLRDIFRDNKIVLVPLNDALIGEITAALLGSLVVAEAWLAAQERATEDHPMDRPGLVVIDECQRFVHLPTSFSDSLSQSRSYGVGWVLAHQSRIQLPSELAEAVDSNARSKVIFRLESAKDAAAMAKLAPGLDPEDFQLLPKHHAYVRVITDGESSGWCTVLTKPPPETTGLADRIRDHSRQTYGAQASVVAAAETQAAETYTCDPAVIPVGRKRRTPTEDIN